MKNEFLKIINQLAYRHQNWQVFSDFVEMSAIAISNSVDLKQAPRREQRYLEIIKGYSSEEQKLFPELLAILTTMLEKATTTAELTDILGDIFHSLELHNKWKGQFFTPQYICNFMGEITLGEQNAIKDYITVCEPCVGSGAMVLGLANAFNNNGGNYQQQMVVTATDIDIKCVHMTYIQLALYGIPAVVIHGNTITTEEWSRWYTPTYIINGWQNKEYREITTKGLTAK